LTNHRLSTAEAIDEATTTRDARFSAAAGFDTLRVTIPVRQDRKHPFDHPIYWACAVVFGA
jgi:hypothetical protein